MSIRYLLDTNILSESTRPIPDPKVMQHLQHRNVDDFSGFLGLQIENWFV